MTENAMTILVIGNGFDLALGLPTQYSDFLRFAKYMINFCSDDYTFDAEKDNTYILDHRIELLIEQYSGNIADNLYSRKPKISEACKDNFWLDYFIRKQDELDKSGKKLWVDFETEITRIISILESDLKASENGYEGELNTYNNEEIDDFFAEHKDIPHDTFKEIHDKLLADLDSLTWLLGLYLCMFVENIRKVDTDPVNKLPDAIKKVVEDADNLKIINFNYTNFLESYLKSINKDFEIDFIHGYADSSVPVGAGNMILGTSMEESDKDVVDFVDFCKYFQRILKKTDHKYMSWVDEINVSALKQIERAKNNMKLMENNGIENANIFKLTRETGHFYTALPKPNQVIFFGHSLDITDGDVIKRLVLAENTATTIYCYSKNKYDHRDMNIKIKNMQKIIGREELIKRTGGIEAGIEFVNL